MHSTLHLGTIVEISGTYEGKLVRKRMLIVEEPNSTIWKDNGLWVRLMHKDSKDIEVAWEVKFGEWMLDCMRERLLVKKEKICELTKVGQLTESEIDEMLDAEGYAEKQRYFRA